MEALRGSEAAIPRRRERRMLDIAGVAHLGRLEQEQLALRIRHGAMLHTAGHDHHFAGVQGDEAIAEVDPELAADHVEQLVLVGVLMPDELALHLDQAHHLAVELGHDLGAPVLGDAAEALGEVDGLHGEVSGVRRNMSDSGAGRLGGPQRAGSGSAGLGEARTAPRSGVTPAPRWVAQTWVNSAPKSRIMLE